MDDAVKPPERIRLHAGMGDGITTTIYTQISKSILTNYKNGQPFTIRLSVANKGYTEFISVKAKPGDVEIVYVPNSRDDGIEISPTLLDEIKGKLSNANNLIAGGLADAINGNRSGKVR